MNYSKDEFLVLGISLAVMVAVSVLLGVLLKNKSSKIKSIPFLVITIVLIALEVVKQILAIVNGYSMWTFPMHFCSTYFVWFALANFSKGKFGGAMKTVAFVASFYLVALFYINPTSIIGDACKNVFESFGTFHTFFFHHLVILYFMLSIALKQCKFEFKHIVYWVVSMTIYYITAVIFANVFDVNYMNILYSNIGFMEDLRLAIGQVGYNIILGLLTVGVGAAVIAVLTKILKIREKKHERI